MKRRWACVLAAVWLLVTAGFLAACGTEEEDVKTDDFAGALTAEEREILLSFADYGRLEVYYGLGGEEIIAGHVGTEVRSWEELAESLSWERRPDNEIAALDPDAAIRIYREDGASLYLAYTLDCVSVSGGPFEDTIVFDAGEDVFSLIYPWAVSQADAEIHHLVE